MLQVSGKRFLECLHGKYRPLFNGFNASEFLSRDNSFLLDNYWKWVGWWSLEHKISGAFVLKLFFRLELLILEMLPLDLIAIRFSFLRPTAFGLRRRTVGSRTSRPIFRASKRPRRGPGRRGRLCRVSQVRYSYLFLTVKIWNGLDLSQASELITKMF